MKADSPFISGLMNLNSGNLLYRLLFSSLLVIIIISATMLYFKIQDKFFTEEIPQSESGVYHPVQLEVLNGCGVSGLAEKFTDFLRTNKFDVVNTGNYRTFNIDYTLVIDRSGDYQKARLISETLGIDKRNVFSMINESYFLDVSLIIGNDFQQLKPFQN
ncbi:MAG: hypothetical protein Kow0098_10320 [Ignavibacteriaceae bacterium]